MRAWAERIQRSIAVALALILVLIGGASPALAGSRLHTLTFHGYSLSVPVSWLVFDLARHPGTCVRFDRHAVYLGVPRSSEACPAHAAGRTEAILLEPLAAAAARSGTQLAPVPPGSGTSFVAGRTGVRVIATWSHQRGVIARALHGHALPAPAAARPSSGLAPRAALAPARAAAVVYTGPGFDACSAPSSNALAAWSSSPYRALNIYIGGTNSACSQPNLSSTWVGSTIAAGWRLISTYVGLQAPGNSCGCSAIAPSQASAQGQAAAQDAVAQAQSLGLPSGTPIYDDMEAYSRGGTNTTAVLNFLSAWTTELHALGYVSGVYSSTGSGVADLVARYGTGYPEPDDIWFAHWNGQKTTSDSAIPSPDWPNHERIHQYSGAHNETYGGVTINIDGDYLDGATAATGGAAGAQVPPPTLAISPAAGGTTNLTARWGGPGLQSWQVLAGTSAAALSPIGTARARGATTKIAIRSAAPYFAVQALGSSSQSLARSSTGATRRHLTIFERNVFVSSANGVGGLPVGCYLTTACHVTATVSIGRTVIAHSAAQTVDPEGTGILHFKLTPFGRRLLAHASKARLAAQVVARDAGGTRATAAMTLIPFATAGKAPVHSVTPSPLVWPVGFTDFVNSHGTGGILSACDSVAPCLVSATVSVGRTTIASARPALVGGLELGYVQFTPTARGRAMLARARGNQLSVNVMLRCGSAVAQGRVTLVAYS
jgi:Rv2525c-like, glycoside hydrolase-like domain